MPHLPDPFAVSPFPIRAGYRGVVDSAAWAQTLALRAAASDKRVLASMGARVRTEPGDVASISLAATLSTRREDVSDADSEDLDIDDDAAFKEYCSRRLSEIAASAPVTNLKDAAALPLWVDGLDSSLYGFVLFFDPLQPMSAAWRRSVASAAARLASSGFPLRVAEMNVRDVSEMIDVEGLPAGALYRSGRTLRAYVRLQDESVPAPPPAAAHSPLRLGHAPLAEWAGAWLRGQVESEARGEGV